MYKILIYYGLLNIINAQQLPYYNKPLPKDVEVFASLLPGTKVRDPPPLSPKKPTEPTTPKSNPKYPTKEPYPPTFYPKKPPSSTKKPLTTKIPPIYPWTSKKPLNFPSPIYPSLGSDNPPSTSTYEPPFTSKTPNPWSPPSTSTHQPPRTSTFPSTYPSSRWPAIPPKPSFFPTSSQTTPSSTWQPKYPSTVASGTTGTPPWIYPPRPSWPRPKHLISGRNYVTEATDVEDERHLLTGSVSEYEAYNEKDGSFKLGFELRNGISAKVHGYKKNGKLVLEGSYSIFTEDGKPVNIVYKADENNYQDDEPTIFHLDIPSFDQTNLDDENDDLNPVPTYVPYKSDSKILTVDQSAADDEQFEDLILVPTTEHDDEVSSITEISEQ